MHAVVRSLWNEPRPPGPPQRVWRDWVLVGAIVPAALIEGALRPDLSWRSLSVAITLALVPTLLWRRTRPLLMVAIAFATTCVASLATGADVPSLSTLVYVLLLPYALFRWGSGREAVIGTVIMLARVGQSVVSGQLNPPDAFGGTGVLLAAMAVGVAVRYQARSRTRALDQAKVLERERLARDLHDIVAHHVSAIAIRAQAGLATAEAHPDAATDALRVIEAEASRTLTEMRGMVRVLRRNDAVDLTDLAPSPRVSDLEKLAGRFRTGPSVDVEITGELDDLPPPVSAAIYRLAQESVTNAQRHARHATRIAVRVAADDTSVRLRVSDDGDPGPARAAAPPGYGLIGMIERAALLGGTCTAGPEPGRGWTVTAVLPRSGWAA